MLDIGCVDGYLAITDIHFLVGNFDDDCMFSDVDGLKTFGGSVFV